MSSEMSRRKFLKKGAAAAIGLAVVPGTVLGKKFGHTAPSDKLNILGHLRRPDHQLLSQCVHYHRLA